MRKKTQAVFVAAITCLSLAFIAVFFSPWYTDAIKGAGAAANSLEQNTKSDNRRPGQPKPYHGKLRSLARVNIRNAVLDTLYEGLTYPWAMELISSEELLVTEFGGKLFKLDTRSKELTEVTGLPDDLATGKGQIGLMDIALHPEFAANRQIYLSHAVENPEKAGHYATAVTRAMLDEDQLRDVERIFTATPYGNSPSNFGGAMEFDDKGYLYISTGDRSRSLQAQNPKSLLGKIIRLTATGETPIDNPFIDDPNTDSRIYALGVRNPQGLAFDRHGGTLFEAEHGPMGGDEANRIEAGKNYGWPTITYGDNYNTQKKGVGAARVGLEQPLFYYKPSLAVSPLTVYHGSMFPEWEGDLLIGALKAKHVNILDLVDGQVLSEQQILTELKDRVRDIKVAQDGSVLLLMQNKGSVSRLYRDTSRTDLQQPELRAGATVYWTVCASCHSQGLPNVPQLRDPKAWQPHLDKGVEILYQNTIHGVGNMPPKGLCDNCSDAELKAAVDFMFKKMGLQAPQPAPLPAQPNIVIMIADDLGWDDVGVYGNRSVHTPNIDSLAANGLRFDNAFLTTASCSASRASILTGKYPHSNGLLHLHQQLPGDQQTLGKLLADGDYYTASVGKWHVGASPKKQFASVLDDRSDSGTEHWITRLRQRPKDQPFFCWLASRDPHLPHTQALAAEAHVYDPATIDIPAGMVDGPKTREELVGYYAEITRFDSDVGQVMDELERQGVLDNTLVIVMSDNGRPFHGGKLTLYDDGIKTPFILHWPAGIKQPGVREQLVSMVDLAPTLLKLAGQPVPRDMQGSSFIAAIKDARSPGREHIFAERNWHARDAHERAVRTTEFLYKENQAPLYGDCYRSQFSSSDTFKEYAQAFREGRLEPGEAACFDERRDLAELLRVDESGRTVPGNLAADLNYRDVLRKLSAELSAWRKATGDEDFRPYSPPE